MMTKAMSPWELLDVALKEIELIDDAQTRKALHFILAYAEKCYKSLDNGGYPR